MFVRDYFSFVQEMLKAEIKRIKRLVFIIFLGSFLVFFVSFTSTLVKNAITQKYAGRYVLMPYRKGTQNIESHLLNPLISKLTFEEIENTFDNTYFITNAPLLESRITNLNTHETVNITVDENIFGDAFLINEDILSLYKWKKDHLFRYHATGFSIDGYHLRDDVDLLVPKHFLDHQVLKTHDNFITLHTNQEIEAILEVINLNVLDVNYEYKVDDVSINEIFLAIVVSIEKIIIAFSLTIFIISSSNIGTLMPYFINEFTDEITLLRLHGLKHIYIVRIFLFTTITILTLALSLSCFSSYIFASLLGIIFRVRAHHSFIKIAFLFIFQCAMGSIFSYKTIKKATFEVAYL